MADEDFVSIGEVDGQSGRRARTRRPTLAERVAAGDICEAELIEHAREAVLRILTSAPKSRAELQVSLARKGYPEHIVGPVLDRFEDVGLVDDASYAATLVRTRHSERGLARRAISTELRRRGITEDIALAALDQVDDEDERVAGVRLARRAVARTTGLDPQIRLRRGVSGLSRRGYPPSMAFALVRQALVEEGEDVEGALGGLTDDESIG